jgi:hypothetical protein
MHRSSVLAAVFTSLAASCIYANVNAPLAYRSPTPGDVAAPLGNEVSAEACSHLVLWMVAWGDGGYSAAVAAAKAKSGANLIADVQADRKLLNVLSVYQKACTVVRGRVVQ